MTNTINAAIRNTIITGLGIILFIPIYVNNSLFFPFITGKGFVFRIVVEIIFALWLILILREKGSTLVNTDRSVIPKINWMTILVTAFTLIALVADLAGLNPLRSLWSNFERMEGWMLIIHLWAYFLILSSVLTTRKNWHRFFNVMLASGAITAFYGLFQFFGWAATHQGSRVDASLGNSAYMAIYMLINAFIALYMAISHKVEKHLVWIYSIAAALFSFILFQTATRGTIIGWTVALISSCLIYIIWGRKEKGQTNFSRGMAAGAIAFIFIIAGVFYLNKDAAWIQKSEVLGRLASISISDTKTQARGFIWPMAIKGVFENPKVAIIGVGQENFNYIFNAHYNPLMWAHEQWFDRAHNVFLDWLVAGGLIGLIAYLALYIISLMYIVKSDITIAQKSILIGLLIGYGIHNIFVFDNQTSYIMFFTILAFISSFKSGRTLGIFKNFAKPVSEDSITIRDYIFVPVFVIALIASLYLINVRTIQANTSLIQALQGCSSAQTVSATPFTNALSLNQTEANQEIREQLFLCATNAIQNNQLAEAKKLEFYTLAKKEVENQIKASPNDARIYIIAGSFYDAIGDFSSATPLLEKAHQLSPTKQTIIFELATNYLNIGKNSEALALMEQAYLSAPENYTAKTGYIAALITAKQDAKAEKLFGNEPKTFQDPKVLNAYLFTKEYDKAIAIYKDMLQSTPDTQELYSSLAYAYLLSGQNSLAIDTLNKAKTKFPLLKTQVDAVIKQIQEGKFKTP